MIVKFPKSSVNVCVVKLSLGSKGELLPQTRAFAIG